MKPFTLLMTTLLLLSSCASTKKTARTTTEKKDSVRTEIHYSTITKIDTCYVEIPKQVEKTVTKAKHSYLENDYSFSTADIDSLGFLHHSLETRDQMMPVEVPTTTETKDSIIYQNRNVYIEKPVYIEKDLTWAQKAQIFGFKFICVLLAIGTIITILLSKKI